MPRAADIGFCPRHPPHLAEERHPPDGARAADDDVQRHVLQADPGACGGVPLEARVHFGGQDGLHVPQHHPKGALAFQPLDFFGMPGQEGRDICLTVLSPFERNCIERQKRSGLNIAVVS